MPYLDYNDGIPDYFNAVFLILLLMWQTTYSPFVPDAVTRYYNGIVFDGLLAVCFVTNFVYVIIISIRPVVLHLKRSYLIYKRGPYVIYPK